MKAFELNDDELRTQMEKYFDEGSFSPDTTFVVFPCLNNLISCDKCIFSKCEDDSQIFGCAFSDSIDRLINIYPEYFV